MKKMISAVLAAGLAICLCPGASAAGSSITLPDTLTVEMAAAYAGKLKEIMIMYEQDSFNSACIEVIGEDRYPVLLIGDEIYGSEPEIWVYRSGTVERLTYSDFSLVEIDGTNYFAYGFSNLGRHIIDSPEIDGTVGMAAYPKIYEYTSEYSLYGLDNGRETEVLSLRYLNLYGSSWVIGPEDLNDPYLETPIEVSDDGTWTNKGYEEYVLTKPNNVDKAITKNEFLKNLEHYFKPYFDQCVGTDGEFSDVEFITNHLHDTSHGQEAIEQTKKLYAELCWFQADHDQYKGKTDVLSEMDSQILTNIENAVRILCESENQGFELTELSQDELFSLASSLVMHGVFEPTIQEMSEEYGIMMGFPCATINEQLNQLFGMQIDFTPYEREEMMWPTQTAGYFQGFVYQDTFYYFSDVYFGLGTYITDIFHLYDIGDDLLVAVTAVNENDFGYFMPHGYAITVLQKKDNHYNIKKVYPINEVPPLEEVLCYADISVPASNFKIDYSTVSQAKLADEYINALTVVLESLDTLNDAGNKDLVSYLEYAAKNDSPGSIRARKNVAFISKEYLEETKQNAIQILTSLTDIVESKGIVLDRKPNLIARIDVHDLVFEKPIQIKLDQDIISEESELTGLQIILGDGQHTITLSKEVLLQAENIRIQLEKLDTGAYSITFLDKNKNVIERLEHGVTVTLPSPSALATVQASYGEYCDNWGGQYDEQNQSISFQTSYSGTYQVVTEEIQINDISALPQETQDIIRFMVSRGYLDLNENNGFDPYNGLNRYQFSKALVNMFFALDRNAETTFIDVTQENPYYPFVASAEKETLISKSEDQMFHGEDSMIRANIFASCGSLLAKQKGYAYPEDTKQYLYFADADRIPEWAVNSIALCVKEGVAANHGVFLPDKEINRVQAANILYQVFMSLYETEAVPYVLTEAPEETMPPLSVISGGIAVVCFVSAVAVWYFVKRKNSQPEE